jgi:tryptophan-rich sensory protein
MEWLAAHWQTLGVFLACNFAAATSGAVFRPGLWYLGLRKPPWTPPNWAFPVVWTLLFLANALSGALVWTAAQPEERLAPMLAYGLSLSFNALWSALFFGLRRMDWALAEVTLLWLSIAAVAILFAPISAPAALLQTPYLLWVTIASLLNLRMLQLNPNSGRS